MKNKSLEKVEEQAKMLAGFLYNYEGKESLQTFWDNLHHTDKFLCFHKLHTILKAGD